MSGKVESCQQKDYMTLKSHIYCSMLSHLKQPFQAYVNQISKLAPTMSSRLTGGQSMTYFKYNTVQCKGGFRGLHNSALFPRLI